MLQNFGGHIPDLEERIARLTAPNRADARFSGEKFGVDPAYVEAVLPQLKRDLIVVKAGGKLLLDEKEPGETMTKREYLVQTMALLSQLGLNIFLVHGGQEQLDRAIEDSWEIKPETKALAVLKDGSVRYTPFGLMPLIISTSNGLSDKLRNAVVAAGGNANAYLSSLFIGRHIRDFTIPKEQERYYKESIGSLPVDGVLPDNNFGVLPLDGKLRVIPDREERVLRYLRGKIDKQGAAAGHIVIRGFLINSDDPDEALGAKRRINPKTKKKEDPYRLNGDADNVAAAHASYFSSREIVPVKLNGDVCLVQPKRAHLIEVAKEGGLRSGPGVYDPLVDLITSESDLEKLDIAGGMGGKALTSLQVARALNKRNVPAIVKIMHMRELLPYLLGNEPAIRSSFGSGYGTTFVPRGLDQLRRFYGS